VARCGRHRSRLADDRLKASRRRIIGGFGDVAGVDPRRLRRFGIRKPSARLYVRAVKDAFAFLVLILSSRLRPHALGERVAEKA